MKVNQELFMAKLLECAKTPIPTDEQAEMDFMQYFLRMYSLLCDVSNFKGFARGLDYSTISHDDIEWIAEQISCIPNAEEGGWRDGELPEEEDILRDRALRVAHGYDGICLQDVVKMKAVRQQEEYF